MKELRAERVAAGLCGYCGDKRKTHEWLCDSCADKHRDRQRKRAAKKDRRVPCPHCDGDGSFPDTDGTQIMCHICVGEGLITAAEKKLAMKENGWDACPA